MQDKNQQTQEDIIDQVKDYIKTRTEIVRLSAIEKLTRIVADIITEGFVIVSIILAFIFASFTLGFYLSDVLGSYSKGFGCVSLLYLAFAIIMYVIKDRFVEKFIIDFLISRIFKNESADEKED